MSQCKRVENNAECYLSRLEAYTKLFFDLYVYMQNPLTHGVVKVRGRWGLEGIIGGKDIRNTFQEDDCVSYQELFGRDKVLMPDQDFRSER